MKVVETPTEDLKQYYVAANSEGEDYSLFVTGSDLHDVVEKWVEYYPDTPMSDMDELKVFVVPELGATAKAHAWGDDAKQIEFDFKARPSPGA